MTATDWTRAVREARVYVLLWDGRVTFGQTYHFLTQAGVIPDTRSSYRYLSELTTRARKAGAFPEFGVARGAIPVAVTTAMAMAAEQAFYLAKREPGLGPWRQAIEAALEAAP